MSTLISIKNSFLNNKLIFLSVILLFAILFRKFFLLGQVPMPGDILIGGYYPWLDNKWGYPVSVPVLNNLPSDVISIIYPWRLIGINMIKQGVMPLWDNSILLGVPLLANFQSALLTPVNLLFFVLPELSAWSIQVMLQIIMALVFMYMFLKDLGLDKYSSSLGGIFYALSGFMLVWLEYNTISYTVAYLPLLLFLVSKLTKDPKLSYSFYLSLVVVLTLFSGYPLTAFVSIGFAFLYFLYLTILDRRELLAKFIYVVGGLLGGILLAAVQLIPGLEAGNLSVRMFDNTALAGDVKYLALNKLITFFVPDFYGNPGTSNFWGTGSYDNFAFFIPIVGIYFFIISLISLKAFKKSYLVFLLFIVFSLIAATANPIVGFLEHYKVLDINTLVNTRVLFVTTFSASVLAAAGTSVFYKKRKWIQKIFIGLVPVLVYAIIASVLLVTIYYVKKFNLQVDQAIELAAGYEKQLKILQEYKEFFVASGSNLMIAFRNSAIPSIVMLLAFAAFMFKNKRIRFAIIIFAVFVSSRSFVDKYISFTPAEQIYPQEESISQLKQLVGEHRFQAEAAELIPPNTWSVYGLSSPSGQNVFTPLTTARYLNIVNQGGAKDSLLTRFNIVKNNHSPLLNTLDVEYHIALNRHETESIPHPDGRPFPWNIPDSFEDVYNKGTVRVYKNSANLGSAWFSQNVECSENYSYVIRQIVSEEYNAANRMFVDCIDIGIEDAEQGSAELASIAGGKKIYKVDTPVNNYLTISSAVYPGWEARIDGENVEVLTANTALQSVYVPSGSHELVLSYVPESFKRGLAISTVTLVLWSTLLAVQSVRKKNV